MTYDPMFDPAFRDPEPAPPAARRRSAETWERVRADYLAGVSAPRLCERYDVGLSALRTRARDEGWRRTDAPDPAPEPAPEDDEALLEPALAACELADLAWARLSAAIRRGRLKEALGWERLHRSLRKLAEAQAGSSSLPLEEGTAGRGGVGGRFIEDAGAPSGGVCASARPLRAHDPLPATSLLEGEGNNPHDLHDPHADLTSPLSPNRAQRRARLSRGRKAAQGSAMT